MTTSDLRKLERDAKRRRAKYKSVHTNRKSYMEVIGEVISGQMELYEQWLLENNVVQRKNTRLWGGPATSVLVDNSNDHNESSCSLDGAATADKEKDIGKNRRGVECDMDYNYHNNGLHNLKFKQRIIDYKHDYKF